MEGGALTHYSVTCHDPKGREYLIVVLPTRDAKVPKIWPWEVGVVVIIDSVVVPLHSCVVYAADAGTSRRVAAEMAAQIEEGIVKAADVYTDAR
jgi:hypothetical protein